MRYQNLFINSYNKSNTDTNYDYNLSIPEHDISCREDEEISLTLTSFNTPNVFYNIKVYLRMIKCTVKIHNV
jgi:hypothetical protein